MTSFHRLTSGLQARQDLMPGLLGKNTPVAKVSTALDFSNLGVLVL